VLARGFVQEADRCERPKQAVEQLGINADVLRHIAGRASGVLAQKIEYSEFRSSTEGLTAPLVKKNNVGGFFQMPFS